MSILTVNLFCFVLLPVLLLFGLAFLSLLSSKVVVGVAVPSVAAVNFETKKGNLSFLKTLLPVEIQLLKDGSLFSLLYPIFASRVTHLLAFACPQLFSSMSNKFDR